MNIALVLATLVTLPLLFWLMMPRGEQIRAVDPALLAEPEEAAGTSGARTPAQWLEDNPVSLYLFLAIGVAYLAWHFANRGFSLTLDIVILLFFVLGMALHARPSSYLRAFNRAGRLAGPLALQYPLYGGIMGLLTGSGLAGKISQLAVSTSTEATFPFLTFVSASVVNFFVPSGGGQWAVQGPVMIPAALDLGVSPAETAMAVAFGDQLTNMLQPFWALPILAIAGLGIRHIMGYCVMTFILCATICTLVLFLLT